MSRVIRFISGRQRSSPTKMQANPAQPDTELGREFAERGPWVTKFNIDGNDYGGSFDAGNDIRMRWFVEYFKDARTILELGSLEGGHTFALSQHSHVERVLALEARADSIERARFVQELLKIKKAEFVQANLETVQLADYGSFDAILCSGLLYHLPEPWQLLEQFPAVSPNLFLSTHYVADEQANVSINGFRGVRWDEGRILGPLSGLSRKSFWPTLGSLIRLLTLNGYKTIHIFENNLHHPNGLVLNLAATAS
jgi:SAM-dependent methyltransferase